MSSIWLFYPRPWDHQALRGLHASILTSFLNSTFHSDSQLKDRDMQLVREKSGEKSKWKVGHIPKGSYPNMHTEGVTLKRCHNQVEPVPLVNRRTNDFEPLTLSTVSDETCISLLLCLSILWESLSFDILPGSVEFHRLSEPDADSVKRQIQKHNPRTAIFGLLSVEMLKI